MSETIYFRGTREELRQLVGRLALTLSGRGDDAYGIGKGFSTVIGFAALSDIKDNFVTCANGGTGELGVTWPPLSKAYLAYGRRFGVGEQAALKKAVGLGAANRYAPGNKKGLLDAQQLKRWKQLFARYFNRLMLSLGETAAKAWAAKFAWADLKREGAKTKLDVFGNRKVQILRDTGVLLNSLSPGVLTTAGAEINYRKPAALGGEQQLFEATAGTVIVGTTVPYAAVHNYGHPAKPKMPRRQFLPDDERQVPDVWWQRWLDVGLLAVQQGMKILVGNHA